MTYPQVSLVSKLFNETRDGKDVRALSSPGRGNVVESLQACGSDGVCTGGRNSIRSEVGLCNTGLSGGREDGDFGEGVREPWR